MALKFYINGNEVFLEEGSIIPLTKQVNTFRDLKSRQVNYTPLFKAPKSPQNNKTFEYLGVPGTSSRVPYVINKAIAIQDGYNIIEDGLAYVKKTDGNFNIYVYEGVIDLYKAIEDNFLSDLDLAELEHQKSDQTIQDSWNDSLGLNYCYIVADFNGEGNFKNGSLETVINTDYLNPAVSVKYLWDKIFETYGFTYSGNFFIEEEFTNLWFTYPKGIPSVINNEDTALDTTIEEELKGNKHNFRNGYAGYLDFTTPIFSGEFGELAQDNHNTDHFRCLVAGYYKIVVQGSINIVSNSPAIFSSLELVKNGFNIKAVNINENTSQVLGSAYPSNNPFTVEKEVLLYLNVGDTISFMHFCTLYGFFTQDTEYNLDINIFKLDATNVDFSEAFLNFPTKDFINEVLWRFGLTPIKRDGEKHYEFLTLSQRISDATSIDWSDKYIRTIDEEYLYEDYAINNYFKFKYANEGESYFDGNIKVYNENLNSSRDLIQSKTYAADEQISEFETTNGNIQVPVFRMWEKDVKDVDGETQIDYKPLKSRYYFCQRKKRQATTKFGSKQLGTEFIQNSYYHANTTYLKWNEIINKHYLPLFSLLNDTRVITAEINLTVKEFKDFTFKKPVYIKQLGGSFICDIISKFVKGQPTKVELVSIKNLNAL